MSFPTIHRRHALAAAALGRQPGHPGDDQGERDPRGGEPMHAVTGHILDVSPHLILIETPQGTEERLIVAPWAVAWRGGTVAVADLPAGAHVVMRALREGKVVDRIWADITRITGTILSLGGSGKDQVVEIDCGHHRGRRTALIPYRVSGRLRVRHPRLEPGYLFDAIGVRADGETRALIPAASQPTYRAYAVPAPPPAYGGAQSRIFGAITWSDGFDEDERGAAYPMLERSETGCPDAEISCVGLPYLALGSMLGTENLCTGRSCVIPIVACGCLAGKFCDRCVECDTSPRGRIAEVSPASFVELGGDLIKSCFNARIRLG